MIIDGINIATTYSATLLYGSLNSVIEYPSMKAPLKNDWAEFDGVEVDLTNPILDKKDIDLNLLIAESKIDEFITFLKEKTYRIYHFDDLNTSFKLRCLELSDTQKIQGRCFIKLKLSDDFPLDGYVYEGVPSWYYFSSTTITFDRTDIFFGNKTTGNSDLSISGISFSAYGISVLEGTKDSLEGVVKIKEKLEVKSKFISGVSVAEQVSKTKEYNATLKLFMNQDTNSFLNNYKAFLYEFVMPDVKILYAHGKEYQCYYSDSNVQDLIVLDGIVWCSFSVNIVVI
jgi:hypothetical protein